MRHFLSHRVSEEPWEVLFTFHRVSGNTAAHDEDRPSLQESGPQDMLHVAAA